MLTSDQNPFWCLQHLEAEIDAAALEEKNAVDAVNRQAEHVRTDSVSVTGSMLLPSVVNMRCDECSWHCSRWVSQGLSLLFGSGGLAVILIVFL